MPITKIHVDKKKINPEISPRINLHNQEQVTKAFNLPADVEVRTANYFG